MESSNALVYTLRSVVDLSVHLSGLNVVKNLDDENLIYWYKVVTLPHPVHCITSAVLMHYFCSSDCRYHILYQDLCNVQVSLSLPIIYIYSKLIIKNSYLFIKISSIEKNFISNFGIIWDLHKMTWILWPQCYFGH